MTTFDELRSIPLFEGHSDEALREVEPVEHLYVILEGELRMEAGA